jgi:hypothetical protein
LAVKLASAIYNPVVGDSKLNGEWATDERNQFELGARVLASEMEAAIQSETTTSGVVQRLRKLFGSRVPNDITLVSTTATIQQIRSTTPARAPSPKVGTSTSG